MRVVHFCLSCFFIDEAAYQENELIREHVSSGHEVLVIASTEMHSKDGKVIYVAPSDYKSVEGARVVRLPYSRGWPAKIARKLRAHPGVLRRLQEFQPDAMIFHGACGWELLTAARYAKAHPRVPFYVDSHEDWNNSARSFISRELLHRICYGAILRRGLSAVWKVLCVSTETMDFVEKLYRVPRARLEFYPLGGRPILDGEYQARREKERNFYQFGPEHVVFVQSGKQTQRKKLVESLRAFAAVPDPRFRLLIAGVLSDDIRVEVETLIARDSRVRFVGWRSSSQLTDLLCAADIYLQPGTQSVTMQHSLCTRCAIVIDDVPAHAVYHRDNGWLISSSMSLEAILLEISTANPDIGRMQARSFKLARDMLDYVVLAERVLR